MLGFFREVKMKNKIISLLLLLSHVFAVGEAGAIFLLIAPGASAAGTGEAQVAKVDDSYASYYNPAGLGSKIDLDFQGCMLIGFLTLQMIYIMNFCIQATYWLWHCRWTFNLFKFR